MKPPGPPFGALHSAVASHAEAWIETGLLREVVYTLLAVASHAEAWIETKKSSGDSRKRDVASHAEAWIETGDMARGIARIMVASHAEAWIETG